MAAGNRWRTTDDRFGHFTRLRACRASSSSTPARTGTPRRSRAGSPAVLRRRGLSVDLREVGDGASALAAARVVIGASVHGGRHQHELVEWTRRHARSLNGCPPLFSGSLTAADDTEESRRATRDYIDDFLDDTGWIPGQACPSRAPCSTASTTS